MPAACSSSKARREGGCWAWGLPAAAAAAPLSAAPPLPPALQNPLSPLFQSCLQGPTSPAHIVGIQQETPTVKRFTLQVMHPGLPGQLAGCCTAASPATSPAVTATPTPLPATACLQPHGPLCFLPGQWVDFFIPGLATVGGFSITSTPGSWSVPALLSSL